MPSLTGIMKKERVLSPKLLAKFLGYPVANHPDFNRRLKNAIRRGYVKILQSGYRAHSCHHKRVVVYIPPEERRRR